MSAWNDRCREHLERADVATRAFAARTGLACPPGCGACCLSPHVEASVAELRPLAAALVAQGRAEEVLARVAALEAAGEARCALYEPAPDDPRRGRCGAYELRPLVCRLYGFSARRDRAGAPELVACRTMRAAAPDAVARAAAAVAEAPLMGDHAHALAADAPGEDGRRLPIDRALRRALEAALLRARLERVEAFAALPDEPDDARPDDRRGPRRRPGARRRPRAA